MKPFLPLLLLAAALVGSRSLDAQQKSAPLDAAIAAPLDAAAINETRFNLNIGEVPVLELAPLLEKALGQPINLIVPPHSSEINLPPLKVHQVTLPELFEALQAASLPKGGNTPAYTFQMTSGNIWIFQVLSPMDLPPPSEARVSKVFSLEPYLGQLKIEDIITTVQTAWKMSGTGDNPEVKFHEETKLLIASGWPDKLQVIDSVLNALRSSVQSQKERTLENELRSAKGELEARSVSAELKVEALQAQNARLSELNHKLESELARLQAQVQAEATKRAN